MIPRPENSTALLDGARCARFVALQWHGTEYARALGQVALDLETEALELCLLLRALGAVEGLFGGEA